MVEVEYVPFDKDIHVNELREMYLKYLTWVASELYREYQINLPAMIGVSIKDVVESSIGSFTGLKPPEGILLIAKVDGKVAGTGALKRLREDIGEIKRMYNRPQYRGRGIGKGMLSMLLEAGRESGYTSFMLDTPKFAHAAHHIYSSAGFNQVEEYPESEIPQAVRKYWLFMRKGG
jgi:GNAT superfamily N-acetyltransferase